ncbi:hypothetical protein DLAC_11519 [Tieghemostelium lacteum]|uniref:Uncharacterized protein n=1 Tax=Tieghemostelium lacteum TaxID=361077 RepID=A0A152A517_TIELA|nr:hypothetical protein DLAC_11519 [Tieghemostelium lacteum]|eukprot:KYR01155.1 hypothetical protein DLAC_11519 [Tieghemostelium lacteum]
MNLAQNSIIIIKILQYLIDYIELYYQRYFHQDIRLKSFQNCYNVAELFLHQYYFVTKQWDNIIKNKLYYPDVLIRSKNSQHMRTFWLQCTKFGLKNIRARIMVTSNKLDNDQLLDLTKNIKYIECGAGVNVDSPSTRYLKLVETLCFYKDNISQFVNFTEKLLSNTRSLNEYYPKLQKLKIKSDSELCLPKLVPNSVHIKCATLKTIESTEMVPMDWWSNVNDFSLKLSRLDYKPFMSTVLEKCPTLTKLKLQIFELKGLTLDNIIETLQHSTTLQILKIDCEENCKWSTIVKFIHHHQSIREIQLYIGFLWEDDNTATSGTNNSLYSLTIGSSLAPPEAYKEKCQSDMKSFLALKYLYVPLVGTLELLMGLNERIEIKLDIRYKYHINTVLNQIGALKNLVQLRLLFHTSIEMSPFLSVCNEVKTLKSLTINKILEKTLREDLIEALQSNRSLEYIELSGIVYKTYDEKLTIKLVRAILSRPETVVFKMYNILTNNLEYTQDLYQQNFEDIGLIILNNPKLRFLVLAKDSKNIIDNRFKPSTLYNKIKSKLVGDL